MMNRTGPDWEVDSWYKDRRQPPLAVRLDTIVKFLAEEDVDRCMHWETKLAEIVSYLEWLAHDDDRHQLQDASAQTRAMFNDAVLKAKAHVLFERHHYEPTPLEITRPPSAPLRSTRLNWMTDTHGWPLPGRNPVPDRSDLLPRPIPPRPSSPVNRMLIDKPDGGASFDKFVADEKEWWQRVPGGDDDADHDNLAYIEAKSFDSFVHGDNIGWIVTDPATGQTALPDGTSLLPGSPRSWALERGARRAGLQQMLRALPTGQPPELDTPWRRLVLPTPASTIRAACERADGPQWTPPRLSADQLPAELETMAHTVAYRARLAQIKRMRELARLRVEDEGARDRRWVTLPRNVVNGGPFVWRMLDPDAQAGQDLLRQCRVVMEVLRAALRRVPRPLLEAVVGLAERAASGQFWEEGVPAGLRLADDEWDQVGRGRLPRLLDAEEVEWLKFLAGECVNSKNWTGRFVPDTPRDKYRLFLIFAARVQKLLHDKNPEGLFSRHDAQVTVEELLQAVNAGTGNSAVTKCEFHPFDACSWLDRMKESGHVRFHLDPTCYGVVQRPRVEYFPEHRVVWPTEADNRERPSHLGYIADWSSIVPAGHKPDVSESSAIGNFFRSLAFRLGYTIFALEQAHSSQTSPIQPVPTQHLRSSISKWAHACATMEGADAEPSREELALIRSHIIAEASANETMLAPGRVHHFFDAEGNPQTTLVRDHNWDWASLPTTSTTTTTTTTTNRQRRPRRQFWSVDRWPLGTGYLSDATERAIADDEHLDPRMTHDPFASDPTDRRYMRPKLQPYREEKVLFRPGPAVYPVGDTRLQRETLEARMTDMVAQAIGLDTNQHTWGDTLARLNPFSRPSSRAEDRRDGGKLPPVNPKAVPKSWDPREETEKLQPEEALTGEEEEADEGEAEDETPSVDVAMTGVGESWMAATGLT
ncbi:uncharacterized protein THITE_2081511 [Thermothielavioides terrestris NRRL 8126]|uniref:Uncharacterized protein n=1 Tax=Thermothielavioides terrestris (strain ATCC 38088 / NRRL 8126) TaxID=578455 RepID=G2REU7_THETT|nr:uncharacterized protein THITE_2081511 [Thermothielavioides terrestris NRRL 8126]AEO70230.1 hypothetical protein THITE_2081511 [Thermothielavioides terrestris NRRL 8126]